MPLERHLHEVGRPQWQTGNLLVGCYIGDVGRFHSKNQMKRTGYALGFFLRRTFLFACEKMDLINILYFGICASKEIQFHLGLTHCYLPGPTLHT